MKFTVIINYIKYLQEKKSENIITLQQINNLIETKFAEFENRFFKKLTNSIDVNSGIIKALDVTEKYEAVFPSSLPVLSKPAKSDPTQHFSMLLIK